MDHKDRIVRYMVSNGLKYAWDVNWGEVANLPQFLEGEYHGLVVSTQQNRHKNMIYRDISSDLVLDWHENKKYTGKK